MMEKNYPFMGFIPNERAKTIAKIKEIPKTDEEIIDFVLNKLERHLTNPNEEKRKRAFDNLRKILFKKFIIKSNQFEDYFERYPTPDEMKDGRIMGVIKEQEDSLNKWLNHLSSNDCRYPFWLKYIALKNIIKMGDFDFDKKSFTKREINRPTYKPFPDLNEEALNKVLSSIQDNLPKTEDEKWNEIIETKKFSKMYGYALHNVLRAREQNEEIGEISEWKEYPKAETEEELKERIKKLQEDLKDKGSGWCFATNDWDARYYLKNSNQLIGYTKNKKGELIPRLGITYIINEKGEKMITEARGVANNQNVESGMEEEMEKKMKEFVNVEDYKEITEDTKKLNSIYKKCFKKERKDGKTYFTYQEDVNLTKEELEFIYEINKKIKGFGHQEDSRIKEIRDQRNIKKDLSFVTGFKEEEISLTREEAFSGNIKFHYGALDLEGLTSAKGLKFPEIINGNLYLGGLTSVKGLRLPKTINGGIDLRGLTSAKDLELPKTINRFLDLGGLTSAKGLKLPETIGGLGLRGLTSAEGLELPETINGFLDLGGLTSVKGLRLPKIINGSLYLGGLTSAKDLELPETINGGLDLEGLTSAKGLKLPEIINGSLYLRGLTSAKGLKLPETINGDLNLVGLTSAEGLELPKTINGSLYLRGLTSAEGLELPETVNGDLDLRGLTSAEDLELPKTINGNLYLNSLTSAKGLKFPETVNRSLDLRRLTSAEDLEFPKTVNGSLYLNSLTSAKRLKLPETINGDLDLRGLTSAEGLELPKTINGDLDLDSLTSAKGLKFPETINGDLDLRGLTSAEGLELPKTINGFLDLRGLTSAEGLELPETVNGDLYLGGLTLDEKNTLRDKYPNFKIR